MNASDPLILVTGATGKVGRHFIERLLADGDFAHWRVRALCHEIAKSDAGIGRVELEFARGDRAVLQIHGKVVLRVVDGGMRRSPAMVE